jgi:5-methylcytosine-specific restriction endonuclease McrBC regulatory subunit McrC
MVIQQMLSGQEHKALNVPDALHAWLATHAVSLENSPEQWLGLHYSQGQYYPGDYVGLVWLGEGDDRIALRVKPKDAFQRLDYLAMYLRCAEDPEVSGHLDRCFYCWPEDAPIELIDEETTELSFMIVAAFLRELNLLCLRHLRRAFLPEECNLSGKVKGRIVMSAQLRQNLSRSREERAVCRYQIISDDCRENRILRAALEQSVRWLTRHASHTEAYKTTLWRWVQVARSALSRVGVHRITAREFLGIRYTGIFVHYRQAHRLARMILNLLGSDPTVDPQLDEQRGTAFPPFALCTYELFERYTEVLLRRQFANIRPGYGYDGNNLRPQGGRYVVRPDFLVPEKRWILDCKYKIIPQAHDEPHADIYQVVAYSQHQKVIEILSSSQDSEKAEPLSVVLLYPEVTTDRNQIQRFTLSDLQKPDRSFGVPLYLATIPCPQRQSIG